MEKINSTYTTQIKEFLGLGYGKWFNMTTVIVISIVWFIYYNLTTAALRVSPDTSDYYQTWLTYLGKDDHEGRTPVYPVFIGIITWLTGDGPNDIVILAFQKALRIVSMFYLWKICRFMGLRDRYIFWLITLWTLLPLKFGYDYDRMILPESFSISFTIFYVWSLCSFLRTPSPVNAAHIGVWNYILVLLRPSYLPFFIVSLAFFVVAKWIFRGKHGFGLIGKSSKVGIAATLIGVGLTIALQIITTHRHGNGVYTNISSYNNYFFVRDAGMLVRDCYDDSIARAEFIKYEETGDITHLEKSEWRIFVIDCPDYNIHREIVRRAVEAHPEKILPQLRHRFAIQLFSPMVWSYESKIHPITNLFIPPMWVAYLILGCYLLLSIAKWRKGHMVRGFMGIVLSCIGLGVMLTSYLGAMADWGRLNISIIFIVFVALFQLLQWHRRLPDATD